MLRLFYLSIAFIHFSCTAQDIQKVASAQVDNNRLYLNDGPSQELHYLKQIPSGDIKGLLVIIPAAGVLTEQVLEKSKLNELALASGYAVVVPSINWGTQNRYAEVEFLNSVIEEVKAEHDISSTHLFMGGLSNGGKISLRYAELINAKQREGFPLSGVFAIDSPVDNIHMYEYAEREIARNFSEAGKGEAEWIIRNYDSYYGGSPRDFREKYIANSVYTHGEEKGGNAKHLLNTPIRLYSDLDLDFLLNKRQRNLYDWNGSDLVALTNSLKVAGHKDIEINISMGKGVRLDGRKHPHSWSIMDARLLMEWMESIVD